MVSAVPAAAYDIGLSVCQSQRMTNELLSGDSTLRWRGVHFTQFIWNGAMDKESLVVSAHSMATRVAPTFLVFTLFPQEDFLLQVYASDIVDITQDMADMHLIVNVHKAICN